MDEMIILLLVLLEDLVAVAEKTVLEVQVQLDKVTQVNLVLLYVMVLEAVEELVKLVVQMEITKVEMV